MRILKMISGAIVAVSLSAPALAQVSGEGGPIRIKADRSEVLEKERKVILFDNVDITQGNARLRANIVTLAYLNKSATDASSNIGAFGDIESMTARGEVFYVTPDLKATGGLGIYDALTDTITLTENVVLIRGEDVATGERLVMQLSAGITTLDGNGSQVNMVIIPNEGGSR